VVLGVARLGIKVPVEEDGGGGVAGTGNPSGAPRRSRESPAQLGYVGGRTDGKGNLSAAVG